MAYAKRRSYAIQTLGSLGALALMVGISPAAFAQVADPSAEVAQSGGEVAEASADDAQSADLLSNPSKSAENPNLHISAQSAEELALSTTPPQLRTTVLILDDGSPMVAAMSKRLADEGILAQTLFLWDSGRAQITTDFLASQETSGTVGNFMGIVLPTDVPAGLSADEMATLNAYQEAFDVRQVSMYNWANPTLGLNYAANPGYMGPVDGMTASISPEGLAGGFGYLDGTLQLDDFDPLVDESYGYLATPLSADPNGGVFTPLITAAIPGTDVVGSLMGVYDQGGRERLIITFASNQYQHHFKVLGHGIASWLTRGVSTSSNRNFLSVHSDDVFMSDAKWSIEGNCTIGDGCDPTQFPVDAPGSTVRMEASDIDALVAWQNQNGIVVDQAFNGFGSVDFLEDTGLATDPLLDAAKAQANQIRWINHTWSHEFMGCLQTSNTPPWSCLTDEVGNTLWYPKATIDQEISKGVAFAAEHGLPLFSNELVTGEHSGLATLPQQPVDNPEFVASLTDQGIAWTASDASREANPRAVGSATTVPRYPMNLYYNVSTKQEATSEFNWIYTSRELGGSGLCQDNPTTSTCINPLDLETGFDNYIVPLETRVMFGHIVSNDARPHFAHQSNTAEDGILYPILEKSLEKYASIYADNTPLVNPTMAEAGEVLVAHQNWNANKGSVDSRLVDNQLVVSNQAGHDVKVPVTAPAGTASQGAMFGSSYGGEQSDWVWLGSGETLTLDLPGDVGFKNPQVWPAPPAPAPTSEMPEDAPSTEEIEPPVIDTEIIEEAQEQAAEEVPVATKPPTKPGNRDTGQQHSKSEKKSNAKTKSAAKSSNGNKGGTDRRGHVSSSRGWGQLVV